MDLFSGIGVALGFLVGIPLHQYAHHRLAVAFGDQTPRLMRRLTLSYKAQADPLGSYIIPAIWVVAAVFSGYIAPPFGWGKRHSLNPRTLRGHKGRVVLLSLAGPIATGVIAAIAGTAASRLSSPLAQTLTDLSPAARIALGVTLVNVAMTVFELLPIPGRDGGRVLALFLSPSAATKMEELEQYDVLFLLGIYLVLSSVARGIFNAGCRALTPLPGC